MSKHTMPDPPRTRRYCVTIGSTSFEILAHVDPVREKPAEVREMPRRDGGGR